MWLIASEFLLFSSVLPFAYASSSRLLLLQLCNNWTERSTVLLCCQLPIDFDNISIIWCRFVSDDLWNSVVCFHCVRFGLSERCGDTCYALSCASHTLQSALESGLEARISHIDFSAAFDIDRVNHRGILYKLCSVGIGARRCVVYIDTVSIKSITTCYGGLLSE